MAAQGQGADAQTAEATREQAVPKLERAREAATIFPSVSYNTFATWSSVRNNHPGCGGAGRAPMAIEDLKTAQFARQIADFELDLARAALERLEPAFSRRIQ